MHFMFSQLALTRLEVQKELQQHLTMCEQDSDDNMTQCSPLDGQQNDFRFSGHALLLLMSLSVMNVGHCGMMVAEVWTECCAVTESSLLALCACRVVPSRELSFIRGGYWLLHLLRHVCCGLLASCSPTAAD